MEAEQQEATTFNKGHGRCEYRTFTSTIMLNETLDWPGVQQVCRLHRQTLRKGEWVTDVAYAITSVARARADADTLLQWWRGHWCIENKVHWVRDETFGEDRCRVRTGAAPHVLAAVRNIAINWLRAGKIDNVAAALRENAWNLPRFFAKLGKRND